MNKVSAHITWADAIRSDTAKRNGILNYFTKEQLARMTVLANKVYEPLVAHFSQSIYISSMFRTPQLNTLIGGAPGSQHMANHGAAMDLDAEMNVGVTNQQVFNYIKDNLEFDQLIAESIKLDGTFDWVHVSFNEGANRKQVLKMIIQNGQKIYEDYS